MAQKSKPTRRTITKSKTTQTKKPMFVVTGNFTQRSRPLTARQKDAIVRKVRKAGGTASVRKVKV